MSRTAAPRWLRLAPDLVGVAGLIALCKGAALLHPAFGWILIGSSCLLAAWRLSVLERSWGSRS